MNDTPPPPTDATPAPAPAGKTRPKGGRKPARPQHPLLHTLFTLYPALFGARFLPLKLGVFEDLRAAHPDALPVDGLKVALGLHTRSNRYIEAVASGLARHDLQGRPVEPVAPEHVHHAIVELYRRKSSTPQEPAARQRAVAQLVDAIERSGLGRDGYRERFGGGAEAGRVLLDEALAALGQQAARQEALRRAFVASGKSVEDFADMYGMPVADVQRLVQPD
ncbi:MULTISPECIES: ProQ/FINO family protein [Ramlibacter]|uniref:Prop effector n=1 Tax=Ramlibacter pinisoli TaxID=2682844 RepID=A0A6N8IRS7_9BURK|nr:MULTISPECIES: ProQ/FINO family protein [Ramlibacter]MBA2964579.1 prop effector [Ramlibacter sp. CGMCC 1.13660]MVQ29544.1 prop effector [Ramlibacter pinisoli]